MMGGLVYVPFEELILLLALKLGMVLMHKILIIIILKLLDLLMNRLSFILQPSLHLMLFPFLSFNHLSSVRELECHYLARWHKTYIVTHMRRGHHVSEIHNFARLHGLGLWQWLSDHRDRRPQSSLSLFNRHQARIAFLMVINSLRDSTCRDYNHCVVYSLNILDIALRSKRNVVYPLHLRSKVLWTEKSLIILMIGKVLMRLISSQYFWTLLLLLI